MVAKDLDIVGEEVQRIARATGLTLVDRVYKGGDFSLENVRNAVQSVQAGPDDVVFFYYSGHGFRTAGKQNDWPYFFFHSDRTIDFGWVVETLNAKGARMTVSLVDACNNVVDVQIREAQKGLPEAGAKAEEGYRELFLRHRGTVAGASSIPGETSTATGSGSLFTLAFLQSLRREIGQARPSWQPLMEKAAGSRLSHQSTGGQTFSQQPFYRMQVARIEPPAATPGSPPPVAVQPTVPQPTVQVPTAQPPVPQPTVRAPAAQPPAVQPPPPQPAPAQPGGWVPITQ
jgi:hypothetical protein